MAPTRTLILVAGFFTLCLVQAAAPPQAVAANGAAGVGDPLLSKAGNGGYDVKGYDLDLRWRPKGNRLNGTAEITAEASQELSRFNLDLRKPLKVRSVRVNGEVADFEQRRVELEVTPPTALGASAPMRVEVRYRGRPKPISFPGPGPVGWIKAGGGAWVANEPNAASTWFPVNGHPTDKAVYRIKVNVPKGLVAVSNGELQRTRRRGRRRIFVWRTSEPMASYLATATIGRFKTATPKVAGLPSFFAWKRSLDFKRSRLVGKYRAVLRFFEGRFGRYPFQSTGGIVFGPVRKRVGYALETQNRPLFQEDPLAGRSDALVVHEIAHQWFGNSVTHSAWDELWLNEGFATWAQWLWEERSGGKTLEETFRANYRPRPDSPAERGLWEITIGAVEAKNQIANRMVYIRGALTLEALREKIGTQPFFKLLRQWLKLNMHGNVTTEDFIALAENESGLDLEHFFNVWLYRPVWPKAW